MESAIPNASPEYSGYKLVGVAAAFIPLLVIFCGLRFYTRRLTRQPFWLDDYLVMWSLFLQIGLSAVAISFVKYAGVGRHFAYLQAAEPETITLYWKFLLTVSFYYFFCVAWPKLALLALYYRLFGTTGNNPLYRYIIFALASIILSTWIVTSIFTLNLCTPFESNWNKSLLKTVPGAHCFNQQLFYRYGSIPNIFTDVVMLVLPMPIVWNLHMSTKNKLGLTVVFLTGSLGLATSIVRFSAFFGGSATDDGTWNSVDLMTWTVVEPGVYLITACLPTYRPLYQKLFGTSPSQALKSPNDRITYGSRFLRGGRSSRKKLDTLHGHLTGNTLTANYTQFDDNKDARTGTADDSMKGSEDISLAQYGKPPGRWETNGGIRVENEVTITSTERSAV